MSSAQRRGNLHDASANVVGAVVEKGVTDRSAKAYYREFKKVIEAADVRDPLALYLTLERACEAGKRRL